MNSTPSATRSSPAAANDDAAYIRKVIDAQRKLELSSRAVLLFSLFPPAWIAGTIGLSVSKIIENMEIGHNVMHGQWDWMRDPNIHSTTWEWDNASPADMWKHSHNELHHTYTNVRGKDNDLGYGIMRVARTSAGHRCTWCSRCRMRSTPCFFQYGIAVYDLRGRQVPQRPCRQGRLQGPRQEGARQDPPPRHP